MKLSLSQQKALSKITSEWQSSYKLGIGLNTLKSLVRLGLFLTDKQRGYEFMPTICIKFKLK